MKKTATEAPLPNPQAGGRYVRNADGTLTLLQQTKPNPGRQPPAAKAPAGAATVHPEE